MAKDKKSFILYSDLLDKIEMLTIEERGVLFTHLLEYVNDLEPVLTDRLLLTAWKPIELELKRDLKKYEVAKENKANGGRLGNLKRWNLDLYEDVSNNKITLEEAENIAIDRKVSHTDSNLSHSIASVAVNDNVNVNDIITIMSEVPSNDNSNLKLSEVNETTEIKNSKYFKITLGFRDLFLYNCKEFGIKNTKHLTDPKFITFSDPIRLLIESDGYNIEDLRNVYDYLKNSKKDFWKKQIYSTSGLREKFNKIIAEFNADSKTTVLSDKKNKLVL